MEWIDGHHGLAMWVPRPLPRSTTLNFAGSRPNTHIALLLGVSKAEVVEVRRDRFCTVGPKGGQTYLG